MRWDVIIIKIDGIETRQSDKSIRKVKGSLGDGSWKFLCKKGKIFLNND